jgi:hypothetical protein
VSFSNRVFIDKVVGIWSGKSDEEHCETVGDYFKASRAFVLPPAAIAPFYGRKASSSMPQSNDFGRACHSGHRGDSLCEFIEFKIS